jgi:hypothetical protein
MFRSNLSLPCSRPKTKAEQDKSMKQSASAYSVSYPRRSETSVRLVYGNCVLWTLHANKQSTRVRNQSHSFPYFTHCTENDPRNANQRRCALRKFGHWARNAQSSVEDKIEMFETDTSLSLKSNFASAYPCIQDITKWIGFWGIS